MSSNFLFITYQSICGVANCCNTSTIISAILQNSETLQKEFSARSKYLTKNAVNKGHESASCNQTAENPRRPAPLDMSQTRVPKKLTVHLQNHPQHPRYHNSRHDRSPKRETLPWQQQLQRTIHLRETKWRSRYVDCEVVDRQRRRILDEIRLRRWRTWRPAPVWRRRT
jgi:hypothetical protein